MTQPNYTQDEMYALAIDASIQAGAEIAAIYNKDFEVNFKADQSPLTAADLASHKCIEALLADTQLPLLSEEGNEIPWSTRQIWSSYWLIDPLDGTKEFVKRNGEFTVNIALIENGFPIFGVIFIPAENQLFFGGKGIGCYRFILMDERPLHEKNTLDEWKRAADKLPVNAQLSTDIRVMLSRSHVSEKTEQWLSELKTHFASIKSVNVGSSIKFCRVAEGMVQIYPRFSPTMQWDTAAGQAIAEGAGMHVVSWPDKVRLSYHRENLLNPHFMVFDPRSISIETL